MISTYQQAVDLYEDKPHIHQFLMEDFTINVLNDEFLNSHREYVMQHRLGWGEKSFHWMWKLIVDTMPLHFNFLEIGVFRGQITSLISVLGKRKGATLLGVCPDLADSKAAEEYISLCRRYQAEDVQIIVGSSQDEKVIREVEKRGPFDILYIDGSHEYQDVIKDIDIYLPMLARDGLLVMDDASCFLSLNYWFKGEPGVCQAVQDRILTDETLKEELVICHNRIFRKMA